MANTIPSPLHRHRTSSSTVESQFVNPLRSPLHRLLDRRSSVFSLSSHASPSSPGRFAKNRSSVRGVKDLLFSKLGLTSSHTRRVDTSSVAPSTNLQDPLNVSSRAAMKSRSKRPTELIISNQNYSTYQAVAAPNDTTLTELSTTEGTTPPSGLYFADFTPVDHDLGLVFSPQHASNPSTSSSAFYSSVSPPPTSQSQTSSAASSTMTSISRSLSFRKSAVFSSTDENYTTLPDPRSVSGPDSFTIFSPQSASLNETMHKRRPSKYLNDPTVMSMLDQCTFEEVLSSGFSLSSPPISPGPITPSPTDYPDFSQMVREDEQENEEADVFARPVPNLRLSTLKELDMGGKLAEGEGEVMTLRLTLTPAAAMSEDELGLEEVDMAGRREKRGGLFWFLGRGRTRRGKVAV